MALWQGRLQIVCNLSIFPNAHDGGDDRPPPQLLPLKIGLAGWPTWKASLYLQLSKESEGLLKTVL